MLFVGIKTDINEDPVLVDALKETLKERPCIKCGEQMQLVKAWSKGNNVEAKIYCVKCEDVYPATFRFQE